jgi:hypothetical protein
MGHSLHSKQAHHDRFAIASFDVLAVVNVRPSRNPTLCGENIN